jgi:hypothetical protein
VAGGLCGRVWLQGVNQYVIGTRESAVSARMPSGSLGGPPAQRVRGRLLVSCMPCIVRSACHVARHGARLLHTTCCRRAGTALFEASHATLYDFGSPTSERANPIVSDLSWRVTAQQAWALIGSSAPRLVDATLLGAFALAYAQLGSTPSQGVPGLSRGAAYGGHP